MTEEKDEEMRDKILKHFLEHPEIFDRIRESLEEPAEPWESEELP